MYITDVKATENGLSGTIIGSIYDHIKIKKQCEYIHGFGSIPWGIVTFPWIEVARICCFDGWEIAEDFCDRFKAKVKEGFDKGISLDDKRIHELKKVIAEEMGIHIR